MKSYLAPAFYEALFGGGRRPVRLEHHVVELEERERLLAAQPPVALESCCFRMAKAKDGTARVVVYRELGIRHSSYGTWFFCSMRKSRRAAAG